MRSELQLDISGGTLVVTELDSNIFTLIDSIKEINAVSSEGVVPSTQKERNATVELLVNGHEVTVTGKFLSSNDEIVKLEIDGVRTVFKNYTSISLPIDNTWELEFHKDVTVHAPISNIKWAPKYVLVINDKQKIAQLALCAVVTNSGTAFVVDSTVFRIDEKSDPRRYYHYNEVESNLSGTHSISLQSSKIERVLQRGEALSDRSTQLPLKPNVNVGDHGLTTFTFNQQIVFEPVKTIPLWKVSDIAESQSYSVRLNDVTPVVRFGYLLDLGQRFTPNGAIDAFNSDGILICRSHYNRNQPEKDRVWVDLGPTTNITVNMTRQAGTVFKRRVDTFTFESKMTTSVEIKVYCGTKAYAKPTEGVTVSDNGMVMNWEWMINPGTNTFCMYEP
jgi:hypothetical protein